MMRLLPLALCVFTGVILGAVVLPVVMFGSFQAFASLGGDVSQLLRRFSSPHGTTEFWAKFFYGILGGALGGLTGYLLLCLSNQNWQVWARFCLAVVAFPSISLVIAWFKLSNDGYNTVTETVILLWLPTLWCVSLLMLGFTAFKRHVKQVR